jgi:hypothetical protein
MIFDIEKIDNISQNIIYSLKRFPMATISAFLVTIILVSIIELNYDYHNNEVVILAIKVAFVASLGVILFPALRLFWSNFLMALVGIGLLVGYFHILPDNVMNDGNILFRHIVLIVASFLMFIWAPFLIVKISNKNIWEWTQSFILSVVASLIFSTLLYLGIGLALYAIERLFDIEIAGKRYLQLAIIIFGIYGVNLFLAQIPRYILLLQVRTYTKAEEIFAKYILTSLTVGYFLILFAYSLKILVTMQWPTGIVAWISVIFSIIAITTYLFWTPLWERENIKFKKAIWSAILFQTVMLGISIFIRIEEYGITESRYFIALFGAWLVLMSLYFIFRSEASYKWLFLTLTILLIGSQFGKYSAMEVSRRNQIARVKQMLTEMKDRNLTIREKQNIYSTIDYLYSRHGVESLRGVIPNIVQKYLNNKMRNREYFSAFAVKDLGLGDVYSWNRARIRFFHLDKERDIINVDGFKALVPFSYNRYNSSPKVVANLVFSFSNRVLTIQDRDVNLSSFIDPMLKKYKGNYVELSAESMEYSGVWIKILFNSIGVDTKDNNITSINCKILLK